MPMYVYVWMYVWRTCGTPPPPLVSAPLPNVQIPCLLNYRDCKSVNCMRSYSLHRRNLFFSSCCPGVHRFSVIIISRPALALYFVVLLVPGTSIWIVTRTWFNKCMCISLLIITRVYLIEKRVPSFSLPLKFETQQCLTQLLVTNVQGWSLGLPK